MKTYFIPDKKRSKFDMVLLLRILLVMLIMLAVSATIDLYVPLKMLIMGEKLHFSDLFTHIKLRQHFPYIIIIGIVAGFNWDSSKKETTKK